MAVRQPIINGPWNTNISTLGLTTQSGPTALFRTAVGSMYFDTPRETGYYVNPVTVSTTRKYMWVGANGVPASSRTNNLPPGNMYPIPPGAKTTDKNSKDADLICFDATTGELWEAITYQPPVFSGLAAAKIGLGDRCTKAIKYQEGVTWTPLTWKSASGQISGLPKSPLMLRKDVLVSGAHAIGFTLPPKLIYGNGIGPTAVTGGASYTDGFVTSLTAPGIRMGQRIALPSGYVINSAWGTYTKQLAAILKAKGAILCMSGNNTVNFGKFVTQASEFNSTTDKALWAGLDAIKLSSFNCVG